MAVGASGGAKAGSSSAGRCGQQQTSMAGRPERSPPCCDYVAWETQPTAARRSPGGPPTANAASSGGCRAERRSPRAAPPAPAPAASPRMRSQCGALEVRPSTITGAGLGLFAARRFEEGDLLPCECAPLPARARTMAEAGTERGAACCADTGDRLSFAQLHRMPDAERDYVMGLHFNT